LPGTQYFFYEDAQIPGGAISGGNIIPGEQGYFADEDTDNFQSNEFSLNFRVTGTPVGVPDTGASALLLGLSSTVIVLIQRALGRRQQRVLN